eukprot:CAMPEP_0117664498 /NCGR_PEP_ID=MMETSP0804-20121206/9256_1 /TAXON_ID=1074897 /ORGANISM="Tetraselmis astigmatica, Strain CCMP880" /LENGTH=166 /DNA_ID=CAMNT_0005471743 /DNA_START=466 /DNA_END=966 /DNA_ORIENTATION=-
MFPGSQLGLPGGAWTHWVRGQTEHHCSRCLGLLPRAGDDLFIEREGCCGAGGACGLARERGAAGNRNAIVDAETGYVRALDAEELVGHVFQPLQTSAGRRLVETKRKDAADLAARMRQAARSTVFGGHCNVWVTEELLAGRTLRDKVEGIGEAQSEGCFPLLEGSY